jgi:hypothetical protein
MVFKLKFVFFLVFGCTCNIWGQKVPDIDASVSGVLSCTNTAVKLNGSSKTPGVYYTWTGPNGYSTTARSPVTAIPGNYTLTVKDPLNGGTATAIVKVSVDTVPPAGVKATVSGLLTCKDTVVALAGISSTQGVVYKWKGPEGFASDTQSSLTASPGEYMLKVTNPVNGCSVRTKVTVDRNIIPPSGVSAIASGIITCKDSSITLTGTSATKNVSYQWAGPGFMAAINKSVVTAPGMYTLLVTDTVNGCSSSASVQVKQNISVPEIAAEAMDSITCRNTKVTLKASSATKDAVFSWLGPGAFVSGEPVCETSIPGKFTVTVTNPVNGCSAGKPVTVIRDTMPPAGVLVAASGALTCRSATIILQVLSSSPKVTCMWNGPAGFSSGQVSPSVSTPGFYEVLVTNVVNGCTVTKSVKVDQDVTVPEKISASVTGSLSCQTPSVTLDGFSASDKVTYNWIGPQGFKSNEKSPLVKLPGDYELTATNPQTGCTSKVKITVTGNACTKSK